MIPTKANLEEAEGYAFERRKLEIEDAIITFVNEGINVPKMDTWEEKEAWYDKVMAEGNEFGKEEPF